MPDTTRDPVGEYPHAAAVHQVDLQAAANKLVQRLPGHGRQTENLAREGGVSVMMMAMEAGNSLKEHAADGVVTVQLLSGRVSLSANNETFELVPGHTLVFRSGVRHDVTAKDQSVILLTITGGAA